MTSRVKFRLGDMFDRPSDMIVFPCSTSGTVTGFVARRLRAHSIPHPRENMALGEVEILPFEGGEHLAQYVAFAASVEGMSSSADAIQSIGRVLGEFTVREPSVRAVAAPLLGAGAGGVQSEKVVRALKAGFTSTAASGATLTVHVLHQDVFERVKSNRQQIQDPGRQPSRVFISHTSSSDDAAEWVKELALFLVDQGIQARLDRFHLRRGMDLQQWMCNELVLADKVVVVCDDVYKEKADGRLGGVGWETMIIQGDIAKLPPDSTKYQIVVRSEQIASGLPLYLQTRFAFHTPPAGDIQGFRAELLRELLDLPLDPRLEAKEIAV